MLSLSQTIGLSRQPEPAFASLGVSGPPAVLLRGERARQGAYWSRLRFDRPLPRGVGLVLTLGLLASVAAVGATRGGQYQAFVAEQGGIGDFLARGLGFGVRIVTISGQSRLTEPEVLKIAGVTPKDSLPFFDVEGARAKLEKTPLVKQASVRKLYPSQIVIDVVERTPAALWQRDGEVRTVAADGAVIDELRDTQLSNLPFVVGEGANLRIDEFMSLLAAAGDLRSKIRAGILVSNRRWTLKMTSGVEVMLPEVDAKGAIRQLVQLEREGHVIEKDVVSLDLRVPGKLYVRLTEEAAASREAARTHGRGGHT